MEPSKALALDANGMRAGLTPAPIPRQPATIPALIAALEGESEILLDASGSLSRVQLKALAEAGAVALAENGIKPGDRVAASAGNSSALIAAFLSVQRIGAIWVGINTNLAPPEMTAILADCGARIMLADAAVAERIAGAAATLDTVWTMEDWALRRDACLARQAAPHAPDPLAPAAIAYTSGTTGLPKGAVHTNHSIMGFVWGGLSSGQGGHWAPGLRRSVTIPLTILNAINFGPLTAMAGGGSYVVMDRIDSAGVAGWIERAGIEMLGSTPTTIIDLVTRPELQAMDLSSLKFAFTGGAAGSPALRDAFRARFGSELCEVYGMTEAPSGVTGSTAAEPPKPGGVGRALPHIEVAALDDEGRVLPAGEAGELCLRAVPSGDWAGVFTGFLGYWGKPEETARTFAHGWLHTGDMGVVDEGGNVAIVGRKKDMILRGGANIYPAEIERVLAADPDVLEAVVSGLPDARLGAIPAAWVRVKPGVEAGADLVQRLHAACAGNLARYKVPARWFIVEDFPRNAMNKVLKDQLADLPATEHQPG